MPRFAPVGAPALPFHRRSRCVWALGVFWIANGCFHDQAPSTPPSPPMFIPAHPISEPSEEEASETPTGNASPGGADAADSTLAEGPDAHTNYPDDRAAAGHRGTLQHGEVTTVPRHHFRRFEAPGVPTPDAHREARTRLNVRGHKRVSPLLRPDQWRKNHGLPPAPTAEDLPDFVPSLWDERPLARVFATSPALVLYDGGATPGVLAGWRDDGELHFALDFRSWGRPPRIGDGDADFVDMDITHAVWEPGVVYVNHFHRTYAKSSYGDNGYLVAIDTANGRVRWVSQPRVANAQNFVVTGDAILSGYGFTAEPDFVYVIDKATGATLDSISVKTGPDELALKGSALHVRTYDRDYRFSVRAPSPQVPDAPAPPPKRGPHDERGKTQSKSKPKTDPCAPLGISVTDPNTGRVRCQPYE